GVLNYLFPGHSVCWPVRPAVPRAKPLTPHPHPPEQRRRAAVVLPRHGRPPGRLGSGRKSALMVNRNLLRQFELADHALAREMAPAFNAPVGELYPDNWLPPAERVFAVNKLITGRVLNVVGDEVLVDVGYKSEGVIPVNEWYDEGKDAVVPPQAG